MFRSPGESRDPPFSRRSVDKWVPAFAGNAVENIPFSLPHRLIVNNSHFQIGLPLPGSP